MSAHDELLKLCAEMHVAGEKLTYATLGDRRGGGSRRDLSKALRAWHQQRADLLADTALDLPDDIADAGKDFVNALWISMSKRVAERLQDIRLEAGIAANHADQEIDHLHKLLGEQHTEIEKLKHQIERLELQLKRDQEPDQTIG